MYVCCCNAVTDREVAEAIAGGARSRVDVTRACGAGGDCGACHATIEGMLEAGRSEKREHAANGHTHTAHASQHPQQAQPHENDLLPAAALVRGRAA